MVKRSQICELWIKTLRFGPLIALGNVLLTFYRKILPPRIISNLSNRRNSAIQKRLEPLVSGVVKQFKSEPLAKSNMIDEEIIWVCWLQGEESMPEIPRLCLKSIRKYSCGRKVEVITLNNFQYFVSISPVILEKYKLGLIKNCHFADILRVGILAQRGGLWMDATMLCTAPIDCHFLNDTFYSVRIHEYGNFVSRCRWAVYCLRSIPGNRLFRMLETIFAKYMECEDYFMDYFLFDQFISMIYDRDTEIREMIDKVKENNPQVFALAKILPQRFNEEIWKEMVSATSMFKLSWKEFTSAQLADKNSDSYYSYITEHVV